MNEITLIIPAKNEAESLPRVLDELKNYSYNINVILHPSDESTIKAIKDYNIKIFHAKKIPTHGGSIRVFASKKNYRISYSAKSLINRESTGKKLRTELNLFKNKVIESKFNFWSLISNLLKKKKRICGISAPSRASTMINYLGVDENIIQYICEKKGSLKIGKFIPGTKIKVIDENFLFKDQPDYAVIFSWHIAKDLIKILKKKGFKGKFIIPLPIPKVV